MEGVELKAESQGHNSQIMAENIEGLQQCVEEIRDLIKQDDNFSELTAEIYDYKKSKLTKLVNELSRMHGVLADQHEHSIKEISKNTQASTTPIKTQHVDSSNSSSPQVTQTSKKRDIMTPVDIDVTLNTIEGGFYISKREGSESESFKSTNKLVDSPVKKDASKVKETKAHDPKMLLKKISTLEKEQVSLKKKIQNLIDENAILEAEKANVADLKFEISKSNLKIETMGKVLEASRQQLLTADEMNLKLQHELSSKVFDITHRLRQLGLMDLLGSRGETIDALEKNFDSMEGRDLKLHEKVASGLAEIAKRDEQITELNNQINLLKNSHAAEEDRWNTDIESLKIELSEKCEFVDELEVKMVELERKVETQSEVTSEDAV